MTIKLLIADDHKFVRRGLVSMLVGSDIKIVAEAADGPEAIALTTKHQPDVVLLDMRMPGSGGLLAMEKIHKAQPRTRVVIWSIYDNPAYSAHAVARGASGYLLKYASRQEVISVITSAAAGNSGQQPATGITPPNSNLASWSNANHHAVGSSYIQHHGSHGR